MKPLPSSSSCLKPGASLSFFGEGNWIPTPEERAQQAQERAEQERQRAEQAQEQAQQAQELAEQERQRAETAETRLESLMQRLRESGIDPDRFLNG
ncbi:MULTISPECIES: hypothetical protein [unclassified Microcoleus]|uniref:hypothetical protein n=1 Tax=unclassified Microcoleus TaxID=2642155 RepID=UPI002FD79D08